MKDLIPTSSDDFVKLSVYAMVVYAVYCGIVYGIMHRAFIGRNKIFTTLLSGLLLPAVFLLIYSAFDKSVLTLVSETRLYLVLFGIYVTWVLLAEPFGWKRDQ